MATALQGNDVEAARLIGPARFGLQEQAGSKREPSLLAPVNAGQGAAETCMEPVADFDEYYCIGIEHDQIKLATLAPPIARYELQTMP